MLTKHPTRKIAVVIFPGFQILDLGGPLAAFETARNNSSGSNYKLSVVSEKGGMITSSGGLPVMTTVISRNYDSLIIVGGEFGILEELRGSRLIETMRESAATSRRVASVCTGAFILAEAGLLYGKMATTHWKYAAKLQSSYPSIKVDGNRIFTKDGKIWTSAGISAGIDLAIAMIEEDLGAAVARATAQDLVVYHRRPGGQSQFSALLAMDPQSDRVRKVIAHMRDNLQSDLSIEKLAQVAGISVRQFGRIFVSETGETPAKAIERIRAETARPIIEDSSEPIEAAAVTVGFNDPEKMRRAFIRIFGHSPQGLRRMAIAQSK